MFQTKQRRFSGRTNGRRHTSHHNGSRKNQPRTNSFTNGKQRNNFRPFQSAQKLFDKYTALAKEAMSSGDKTLVENYLQHADHFMRIIEDKNKNRDQNKVDIIDKTVSGDKPSLEDNNIKQEDVIKNKE